MKSKFIAFLAIPIELGIPDGLESERDKLNAAYKEVWTDALTKSICDKNYDIEDLIIAYEA